MKITAVVRKTVEIELEVDDKFVPLESGYFWDYSTDKAEALADELERIIENSEDDISEVLGAYDSKGDCIFEN